MVKKTPNQLWVTELGARFLRMPHRLFLDWLGGPRLLETIFAIRALGVPPDGSAPESLTQPPLNSTAASLHDLRTASSREWRWVPLNKIRSFRAQVFSADHHPWSRYLRDGLGGMEEFFELDTPQTPEEYLFIREELFVIPDGSRQPISARVWPWATSVATLPEPPFFPYWRAGPKTKRHMLDQAERLDKILKSVQKRGYIIRQDKLPWYSILLNDRDRESGEYRVLVTHGNHRVAILAHLGWELIPMAPLPTMLTNEVRLSQASSWPGVLDGSYSIDNATAAFLAFFRDAEDKILPGLD